MRSRVLTNDDIRKFRIEPVEGGTRLDRYWQNQGKACQGCRSELVLEDVLPESDTQNPDGIAVANQRTAASR